MAAQYRRAGQQEMGEHAHADMCGARKHCITAADPQRHLQAALLIQIVQTSN